MNVELVLTGSPEFVKRFVIYNKNQSLKFDVYDTNGERNQDISLFLKFTNP